MNRNPNIPKKFRFIIILAMAFLVMASPLYGATTEYYDNATYHQTIADVNTAINATNYLTGAYAVWYALQLGNGNVEIVIAKGEVPYSYDTQRSTVSYTDVYQDTDLFSATWNSTTKTIGNLIDTAGTSIRIEYYIEGYTPTEMLIASTEPITVDNIENNLILNNGQIKNKPQYFMTVVEKYPAYIANEKLGTSEVAFEVAHGGLTGINVRVNGSAHVTYNASLIGSPFNVTYADLDVLAPNTQNYVTFQGVDEQGNVLVEDLNIMVMHDDESPPPAVAPGIEFPKLPPNPSWSDYVIYQLEVIGYYVKLPFKMLSNVVNDLLTELGKVGTFAEKISSLFTFLPKEITTLIMVVISLGFILRILGR